jgi:hypothetical protein
MSPPADRQQLRNSSMKLGIINESRFILSGPGSGNWAIHSFTISGSALSFSEIFDSAFSTPARYVQEMFVRLCSLEMPGEETSKFIFNPLFKTSRLNIGLVVDALRETPSSLEMAVLSDDEGLPAGYLLPAWLTPEDSRFLALLSALHGATDAQLLKRAYFAEASCIPLRRVSLKWSGHNGFQYEGNRAIYRWVADKAIKILDLRIKADDRHEARQQRSAITFTAVMPYHAGDLLFFLIAFKHLGPPVSRLVVNKAYLDIVADNAPALEALPISLPLLNRDEDFQRGNVTPDHAYFERFCDQLPEDGFYGYYRSCRNYNVTKFHLIDHFIFALGGSLRSRAELLVPQKAVPDSFSPELPAGARKILLHFDGGWPLKVYALEQQERLIDQLCNKGYSVTVLAATQYDHPKCRVTTFKDYGHLVGLLRSHHLLVGMDSFPVHYAVHVLGLPTICLFASTRPENSNARPAPNYLSMEKGLRCRPCSAISRCPLYGDSYCRNFVDPETVVAEVGRMLEAMASERPIPHAAFITMHPDTAEDTNPLSNRKSPKTKLISLKYLGLQSALVRPVLPYTSLLSQLYEEFAAAVRSDGVLLAMLRTLRFLHKSLRR